MSNNLEVTLGGDRLGSGNKQKIAMHNFERSTHDLSYKWRSTAAAGTLIPFMKIPALVGVGVISGVTDGVTSGVTDGVGEGVGVGAGRFGTTKATSVTGRGLGITAIVPA